MIGVDANVLVRHIVRDDAHRATLQRLLEIDRFRFEAPELAWQALDAYRIGADFADALLARIHEAAGCDYTATFDQRAATRIKPMRLLTH